jgi:hypothetical protein
LSEEVIPVETEGLPLDDVGCVFDDRRVECTVGAIQADF